jgi:perilipin-2
MFNWAFRTTEDIISRAAHLSAPIVQKLPLQSVDRQACNLIEKLEVKAPIIKEQPQEIYNQARTKIIETVQPHLNKVCNFKAAGQQKAASLKDLSWNKANELLATQYGNMAVSGLDSTAALAEKLLDYYFPKSDTETDDGKPADWETVEFLIETIFNLFTAPISATDDPVLHTVQTVGRLSNRVANRVYRTVSQQIKSLKKEDLHEYIVSLIAVLKLTQYLNFINEKLNPSATTTTEQPASSSQLKKVK